MKTNIEAGTTDWGDTLSSQEDFGAYLEKLGHRKLKWYERVYDFFRYDITFMISDFLFEVKMKWQVLTRGYSDRNVWGMCDDIAELNIKLLTELRDKGHGYPDGLTEKKWKKILTKMIEGFEAHLDFCGNDKKNETKFDEGMDLYKQYFANLWD